MPKVFLGILAVLIVGSIGFVLISACLTWLKVLFGLGHSKLRSDTLEAREAQEDLELAVLREERRKAREQDAQG